MYMCPYVSLYTFKRWLAPPMGSEHQSSGEKTNAFNHIAIFPVLHFSIPKLHICHYKSDIN